MMPWKDRKLGDIFDIDTTACIPGRMPSKTFAHFSIPAWDEIGGPRLEMGKEIESNKFLVTKRAIVLSKLNPRIARVTLFDPTSYDVPVCASTELVLYVPKSTDTSLEFFTHYFLSPHFRWMLERIATGTTNSHVRLRPQETLRWSIPCPKEDEQRSIAHVLDATDAAIRWTTKVLKCVNVLREGILQRFLRDALGSIASADRPGRHIAEGWRLVPTGKLLAEEPKNGVSPPAESQPPGIPTFSIGAVRHGRIDLSNRDHLKYVRIDDKIATKFAVRRGDILVVRGNANPDLVGRCGVIDEFPNGCIYPDILKRIVFADTDEGVLPDYAATVWNHPLVHNQVLKRAQTSNGTLKINSRDVKQIVLPVPPKEQQRGLMKLIHAQEEVMAAITARLNLLHCLKRGLMQDLLTGKVRIPSSVEVARL